jgi:hypothetical protein
MLYPNYAKTLILEFELFCFDISTNYILDYPHFSISSQRNLPISCFKIVSWSLKNEFRLALISLFPPIKCQLYSKHHDYYKSNTNFIQVKLCK